MGIGRKATDQRTPCRKFLTMPLFLGPIRHVVVSSVLTIGVIYCQCSCHEHCLLTCEMHQNHDIFLYRSAKFALSFSCSSAEELAATGFLAPWPPAVPWTPAGGSTPNPHYWPVLPVHHVPPTYSVAPCFMEFWCCRLDVAIRIRTVLPNKSKELTNNDNTVKTWTLIQ